MKKDQKSLREKYQRKGFVGYDLGGSDEPHNPQTHEIIDIHNMGKYPNYRELNLNKPKWGLTPRKEVIAGNVLCMLNDACDTRGAEEYPTKDVSFYVRTGTNLDKATKPGGKITIYDRRGIVEGLVKHYFSKFPGKFKYRFLFGGRGVNEPTTLVIEKLKK